jgi:murein DD-endopeptidase MepM/ murein hydrolase activator NlpD
LKKKIFQGPFEDKSHKNLDAYDFTAAWNSPVFATHNGIVARAIDSYPANFFCPGGQPCAFGNFVQLAGNGPDGNFTTIYAHLLTVTVSDGQTVQMGDIIGYVDATGYTFRADGTLGGGTHLHYQYNGPGALQLPAGCGGT